MKLVIETDKTKAEIRGIIAENTSEFSKNPFFSVGCEYFNGKISEDSFKIRRNISYRNNGLPEINGKIQEITDQNGSKRTKITISIAPMPIIQFITVLWCAVSAFFFVAISLLRTTFAFVPFLFLISGIFTFLPTKIESHIAKSKLEALLH